MGGLVFPAHAGIDPPPRTSGARRGRLPRTRGDRPVTVPLVPKGCVSSPHTRGSTRLWAGVISCWKVFPAHAGIDPAPGPSRRPDRSLPRTRGDRPWTARRYPPQATSSPHTRGSTTESHPGPAPVAVFLAYLGINHSIWLDRDPYVPRGSVQSIRSDPSPSDAGVVAAGCRLRTDCSRPARNCCQPASTVNPYTETSVSSSESPRFSAGKMLANHSGLSWCSHLTNSSAWR